MNSPSIDSELLKFSEINISAITTTVNSLKEKMISLDNANSEILSSLPNVFSSDAGKEAMSQLSSLKDNCVVIKNSVDTELTEILNKSTTLIEGINNLKTMLAELNNLIANAPIKYREEDDGKGGTTKVEDGRDYTEATKYLNEKFKPEEEKLKQDLTALKNIDSSLTILSTYAEVGTTLFDLEGKYLDGIYEIDGVYYQVVAPVFRNKACPLNQHFIISYDTDAIFAALGSDADKIFRNKMTYREYILAALNESVATQKEPKIIFDMHNVSYTGEEMQNISKIFNSVLNSTYKANNATAISDYTALTALTSTNSLFKLGYGTIRRNCVSAGTDTVMASGGKLDCIGFVKWTAYQGILNYYKDDPAMIKRVEENMLSGQMTPLDFYANHSTKISSLSNEEIINLTPGTVLSKEGHVGVLVGTGKNADGKDAVFVSHSSYSDVGTLMNCWELDKFREFWKAATPAEHCEARYTTANEKSCSYNA